MTRNPIHNRFHLLPTPRCGQRIAALVVALATSGCALLAPSAPSLLGDKGGRHAYSWTDFTRDHQAYAVQVEAGGPAGIRKARICRDRMLWSVISDVDWAYDTFRTHFHGIRSTTQTLVDMSKLGIAAASTVLGGSAVLSAAVTALEGSQLSAEKNLLEEKTTALLLTTMDAMRSEVKAQIQTKLQLDPPKYSFEEAYTDALALFTAGTVPSALERLAADAGNADHDAHAEEQAATKARIKLPRITEAAVSLKEQLTDIVGRLRQSGDVGGLTDVLEARGVTIPNDASDADVADLVQDEIRQARTPDEINKLLGQFQAAGLWTE